MRFVITLDSAKPEQYTMAFRGDNPRDDDEDYALGYRELEVRQVSRILEALEYLGAGWQDFCDEFRKDREATVADRIADAEKNLKDLRNSQRDMAGWLL